MKTKMRSPLDDALDVIPKGVRKEAVRVGKATAKGAVEAFANEIVSIIDEFGSKKKKKHKKHNREDWG